MLGTRFVMLAFSKSFVKYIENSKLSKTYKINFSCWQNSLILKKS